MEDGRKAIKGNQVGQRKQNMYFIFKILSRFFPFLKVPISFILLIKIFLASED